jgi:hypothetical protein
MFYGESNCQAIVKSSGISCNNLAYYVYNNKYVCGVHSKKNNREVLLKNPNKEQIKREEYDRRIIIIKGIASEKCLNGLQGHIIVSKLRMRHNPEYTDGYLNIFPNFKHQNRKDGFGCMRLSPMSLGPIEHGMSNLPNAMNLENYHQFAKVWSFELDNDENLLPGYFNLRIQGYNDLVPHRRKYDKCFLDQFGTNVNSPEYSLYYDKDNIPHTYNYIQCRYFYCHFYEQLASVEPDFLKLKQYLKKGYNLCIQGYDGFPINKSIWKCYIDTYKPFGHELVLYTMLIIEDPIDYPWNRYYQENYEIYENVI